MQGAAWIAVLILAFTLEPPGHSISPDGGVISWASLARFVVVFLSGLVLIAAYSFRSPPHLRYWVIGTVLCFVLGLVLLGAYAYMVSQWTCEADGYRLVIGTALTPKAAAYAASGSDQCSQLLKGFATDPLLVWDRAAIFEREVLLGGLFLAVMSALGVGVIALLQALKIAANFKATGPRRRAPVEPGHS